MADQVRRQLSRGAVAPGVLLLTVVDGRMKPIGSHPLPFADRESVPEAAGCPARVCISCSVMGGASVAWGRAVVQKWHGRNDELLGMWRWQ